jgi:hypothetical protein
MARLSTADKIYFLPDVAVISGAVGDYEAAKCRYYLK